MQEDSSDGFRKVLRELDAVCNAARIEHDFGERVRKARQALGITQRDLADAVGLDASAISRLEQGARAVRLGEAALIAKALRTDIQKLAFGERLNNPMLELYGALDELRQAIFQLSIATSAAQRSVDQLQEALENPGVREWLSASPVDADSVIDACRGVRESLNADDRLRQLRWLAAQIVDMDQVHIEVSDDPET